jgi:hypothetical protein
MREVLSGTMPPCDDPWPQPKKPNQRTQPVGGYIEWELEEKLRRASLGSRGGSDVNGENSMSRPKLFGKQ